MTAVETLHAPVDNLVRAYTAPEAASLRSADDGGDGRTLFGHFAVFNTWTEINSMWEGNFLERLAPGAFKRTIAERADQVKVLYDHGRDPQIGNKPLGPIESLSEDKVGVAYEVRLIDTPYNNEFIIPASRENLLGASFRFRVVAEEYRADVKPSKANPKGLDERTITDVELYEFGPVTFPAYPDASAGLRSTTDEFMELLRHDPMFLARFTDRVGLPLVQRLLRAEPALDEEQLAETLTDKPETAAPIVVNVDVVGAEADVDEAAASGAVIDTEAAASGAADTTDDATSGQSVDEPMSPQRRRAYVAQCQNEMKEKV